MEYFVDWPAATATRMLAAAVGMLLAGSVILALRAPLLRRLGLRNIGRRRLRAMLIVVGLALSTTVFGSALSTGDTITYTLQSLVAGTLGSVDEVVVLNPPQARIAARLAAVVEPGFGGLASARLDFFSSAEVAGIQRAAEVSPAIAAIAPAILEQVTVVNPAGQRLQSAIPLLAIAAPISEAFGGLTTEDGQPVALEELHPDEVVLNTSTAAALNAQPGALLELHRQGTVSTVRIRAITRDGGLGGTGALLLMPLASYQQTQDHPGEVNLVLVANHGGVASVARSEEATRDLRSQLADPEVVRQLHGLLTAPVAQRGLQTIEDTIQGRDRAAIRALRAEAARPMPTAEFISLVSEPRMRQRLLTSAWSLPATAEVRVASELLRDLAPLTVLAIKQEALVEANTYGSAITMIFLVLGIFSMAAAALLIGLIFVLLAADRGAELATMRAIGMRRNQILSMFLLEGLVYNLLGAALGMLASLSATYLLARSLGQALLPFGVVLRPHVEPRSLVIAAMGGVVLTFAIMLSAAWRVSHTAIVGATHGEVVDEHPGRLLLLLGLAMLAISAAIRCWLARGLQNAPHALAVPWSNTLALAGAVCCI
ncbi:MAG TPA: ABC transporter permease, partial [Herpetosiphonaceae bacterium]|nr:ABC transporter permease [Herpetosiphonaceae bacterium]